MLKFLLAFLASIIFSSAILAGEQATQIFQQYQLSTTEEADIFSKFAELSESEMATAVFIPVNENAFTLKLYSEKTNDLYIIHKSEGQIEVEKTVAPFQVEKKTFEGEIHGTLFETLLNDTKNEKIARQIAKAFQDDFITTRGLKVSASYSFEVIEYFDNGEVVKFGDVLKVSLIVGKAIVEKVLQQDLKTLEWNLLPIVPEKEDRIFYAPVKSSRVSSLFNLARRHPVKRRIQPHNGIDFVAKSGTPVYPALEGEVIAIGRARAKGKFVLIQHDNGYQTTYDHLRKFKKGLRVGMRVELTDQLGEVGRTGYATGAHLHFGVLKDGLYVDPLYLLKDSTFDQKDDFETSDLEES